MPVNDKLLAYLCEEAYQYDDLKLAGGTQGIRVRINKTNIIAIRGTEFDFEDILRDLRALPWWSRELGCFAHAGFLKAAREVLPLAEDLSDPLIITGHSLGGAIAHLTAQLLKSPVRVVTFGEPRCILGRSLPVNADYTRYVNGDDAVPEHPWELWGYRHQVEATKIGHHDHRFSSKKFTDHKITEYIQEFVRRKL